MIKVLLSFLLFLTVNTYAQKKHTITERNFSEFKKDLDKAQKGLDMAKRKLAKVQKTCELIAQKKVNQLKTKELSNINGDSVLQKIKHEKRRNFEAAEARVGRWQKRFDRINNNYNAILQHDSIVPNRHDFAPVVQKGGYITFNPAAIGEFQQGAVGLGLGYRVFKQVEIWTEASYLFKGFGTVSDNFKNLQGFRGIISGKYFYKNKHHFFVGLEFRVKQYSYDDKIDFENKSTIDTLFKLLYQLKNTLYGGAAFFGKRFKISHNGKFEVEVMAGAGAKYRVVSYNKVPTGYSRITYTPERGPIHLFPVDYKYTEQWIPYFPATVRLVYHF